MRRIPEQIRKNNRPEQKNQEAEKKTDSAPGEAFAPECASAAAAEASRVLGFGFDVRSGSILLSGGNQLLLSIMRNSRNEAPNDAVNMEFSEISPENDFQTGVAGAEAVVPEFTGQLVGMTDLASFT